MDGTGRNGSELDRKASCKKFRSEGEIVVEKIYRQNQHKTVGSGRHNYQILDINGNLDRNENQSNRIVEEKM